MIMGMYDERGLYIIFGTMAAVAIIGAIMIIAVYILIGLLLSKLNKLIYGKNTVMAWIPPFNVYLLGKLTVGKWLGWFLVLCDIFNSSLDKKIPIFPELLGNTIEEVYSLGVIVLFICAIIKYDRLKNNKKNCDTVNSNQIIQTSNSELNPTIKNIDKNMMMNDKVLEEKSEQEIVSNVSSDSSSVVSSATKAIGNNTTTTGKQKAESIISDNIQNDKIDSL